MVTLAVLVVAVQTLLLELDLVDLEHQGKEMLAALDLVALIGLAVVAVAHLLLEQITQLHKLVVLVVRVVQAA
jgi:hypothetical protein